MADIFASRPFDLHVLFKNQGLTEDVQRHVARVYTALTAMVGAHALSECSRLSTGGTN